MSNFGSTFKKAREARGVSLDQIASETRISSRFLKAIEDEEFHVLPGGIFNRGFIRTYAERIGLNPDQAVRDYERFGDTRPSTEPLSNPAPKRERTGDRHLYPIVIGGLILLIVIFYVVTRDSTPNLPAASPAPPPPVVTEPSAPAAPAAPEPPPPAETAATAPEPAPEPPAPPAPADGLTLDIETSATTWVKVRGDGKTLLAGEILQPGTTRRFTAQDSLNVIVGNAGGITLKINDQEIRPLGRSGQIREVTITPENLKDFTS